VLRRSFGQKIFRKRLHVGLAVALIGLEVLVPKPFLQHPYFPGQILALLAITAGLALRA
jgi:hypothetical protein